MRRIALALLLLQALPDTPLMAQDTFPPPGTPAPRPSASVLMQAFAPVDERIEMCIRDSVRYLDDTG